MKKVIVTGATGFIGTHCLPLLSERGFEIHAVSSKPQESSALNIKWHQINLLNVAEVPRLFSELEATHLLHLAWYVIPGNSATHMENFLWVKSSLELLRQFAEHGGKRVVFAGSSFEYDWNYGYCSETITPTVPSTFYGICKNALQSLVAGYVKQTGLSSAWPRIFFLYGPNEHPDRLVPAVISSLLRGDPARTSHGNQIRDYLYVKDVAEAMVQILDGDIEGPVNIGSGIPITLKEIICRIGRKMGREELLQIGAIPSRANDLPLVVANNSRLTSEVGWQQKYDLDVGLEETIEWWKSQLKVSGK